MSRIPILCYHHVGPAPAGTRFAHLYATEAKLDRQLWAIARLGLRGVSMTEGFPHLRDAGSDNTVVLTFDDGLLSTLTAALPLLRQYGFGATCYVVTDCIGGHNRWDDGIGGDKQPLMTREQIGQWLAAGMEIASHSCSHPRLQAIDDGDAAREISDSRVTLQRLFGVAVDHFGYPFGAFNGRTVELVRSCGYVTAVTTQPGIARHSDDALRLPRLLVNGERGLGRFLLQVGTPYEDLRHGRGLSPR
jgi:peptidoglycan/xylan/chitin deacetylase (PgdA/CDA1 family)